MELSVREYVGEDGVAPFGGWFDKLNTIAAAKVTTAIARLQTGNLSNAKSVGAGVYELRIDFGPGYRVYFGYERADVVILIAGGTKKGQQRDIQRARHFWRSYKRSR